MITFELRHHKESNNIATVEETTNITYSGDSTANARVFFEDLTKNQAKLYIGKYCSIATRTSFFLGGNHNHNRISTWLNLSGWQTGENSPDLLTKGDIIIGNDVWIGMGAVIMSGVKIGDGAIIGTNAVVAKDIAPYAIAVGNPAKEIKKRFDDRQIEILLASQWWNWDYNFIKDNSKIIFGENFALFEQLVKKVKNI